MSTENSKTPQFDSALDALLVPLVPHKRTCATCENPFPIEEADIEFYRMLRVPPPTLCPLCRKQRRFGQFMRTPKFFKKQCTAPGHTEEVVSIFPPSSPHAIYDFTYYHSDSWDASEYGRIYDLSLPFFTQFKELFFTVPHISLEHDPAGTGVEYTLGGRGGKNNYYCSMGFESQDCLYAIDIRFSKDIVDSQLITNSERCYQSVGAAFCNNCIAVVGCSHCIDSSFLYDCKNCSNCFLSSNLRNESHVFGNERLTKEEYQRRIADIDLGDRTSYTSHLERFEQLMREALHRSVQTVSTHDSVGDSLMECNRCYFAFQSSKSDHVRYVDNLLGTKDTMDAVNILGERFYESVVAVPGRDKFSLYVRNSTDMEYCIECYDCHDCFGCVGLKNKQFHILNAPYSEDEYWNRVDELKAAMLVRGEYGELFPLALGLFPYQSSTAQKEFPLTESQAASAGIPWYDEPASDIPKNLRLRRSPHEVPANIKDVTDEILDEALVCESSSKPFRVTRAELDFYRRMELPLPTEHPWQRMQARAAWERGIRLYPFTCPKCGEASWSTYDAEKQQHLKIYCEKCYLKEVI